jgi:hypothetical protein
MNINSHQNDQNNLSNVKKTLSFVFIFAYILLGKNSLFAQQSYTISHDDSLALEKVIVEKYYEYVPGDYTDTIPDTYPIGATTYRIYIDMKPGYSLQAVYGTPKHELFLKTTTTFFNDQACSAKTGFNIDFRQLHTGVAALDSWITMGAASHQFTGILKSEDDSLYSYIKNRKSLSKVDGLTNGILPNFQVYKLDLGFFNNDSTASNFTSNDGAWAALGGVRGPTPENRVLIAQLTTTGKLSFRLNVQIGTPTGATVQFVAKNPEGSEIKFDGLTNE